MSGLPNMIGLTGYAYVGKDTLANLLVERFDYRRVGFADPLYAMLLALDPVLPASVGGMTIRVSTLFQRSGGSWTKAKKDPFYSDELRDLLQRLGTEAAREYLGEDVWLRAAQHRLDSLDHPRIVISDVRFPNEVEWVKHHEGVVVRILRPGHEPVNEHISDAGQAELNIDYEIVNDGEPVDLLVALMDVRIA